MATATAVPSPYDIFGPHALRPEQVYEHAVEAVLAQCRDRLRRGVSADTVARLLRGQYIRLAALAAVVETADDAALDDPTPRTLARGHGPTVVNIAYLPPSNPFGAHPPRHAAADLVADARAARTAVTA